MLPVLETANNICIYIYTK